MIKDGWDVGINAFQYLLTIEQTEGVLKIISLVLSILTTCIITADKIIKWYKKSKADGKITKEEIKEGIDIVSDTAKDIADKLNDEK